MEFKAFIVLSLAIVAYAAPAKMMMKRNDDMMTSEGRNVHSYAPPPASTKYVGGGTVTSYNRRGSYASTSDLSKPSIYGNSYAAPAPVAAPAYRSAPVGYAPVQRYPAPELSHAPSAYHSAGPQRNAYSEESRHASQDPHYDPAKDPVSQYAQYVPVFEYGTSKSRASGDELSLYGYRRK